MGGPNASRFSTIRTCHLLDRLLGWSKGLVHSIDPNEPVSSALGPVDGIRSPPGLVFSSL